MDGGWLVDCDIVLTEAEVERLAALVTARRRSPWERAQGWRLFWWQMALGSGVAVLAVLLGASPPERAGGIAVAAFLACWAAMALYRRAVEQGRRRYRLELWQAGNYSYRTEMREPGVRLTMGDTVTDMSWQGFSRVEVWGGFLLLWRGPGSPIAVPLRAVPPSWSAEDVSTRCNACIERLDRPSAEDGSVNPTTGTVPGRSGRLR